MTSDPANTDSLSAIYAKGPMGAFCIYGGERGIRTLDGLLTHTPLAGECLQPLGHLSGGAQNNRATRQGKGEIGARGIRRSLDSDVGHASGAREPARSKSLGSVGAGGGAGTGEERRSGRAWDLSDQSVDTFPGIA
jgi:hypothetical protein